MTTTAPSFFPSLPSSAASARPPRHRFAFKPLRGRYDVLPIELFRINASPKVILRDWHVQHARGSRAYDLCLGKDGLVHPKPGKLFEGPNGASLRPLGPFLNTLITSFHSSQTTIYRLPAGLVLPPDLVLLHEHTDHYSLQCAKPMSLQTLNQKLTRLCMSEGEVMGKREWLERYGGEYGEAGRR